MASPKVPLIGHAKDESFFLHHKKAPGILCNIPGAFDL